MLAYLAFEGASYDIVPRQSVALMIWAAIAVGLAVGVFPRARLRRSAFVPLAGALLLLLWMLLSLSWTDSAERTLTEIARFVAYAGVLGAAVVSLNRFTFRAAAAGLSAAAVAVTAAAVISRLSPSTFPQALDVAGTFSQGDRLTFPLDYWNAVGAWAAMTAAACVAWSSHARLAITRGAALSVVPIAALAIYLSYSRGGVIAGAAGALAVVALSRNRWTAFIHTVTALGAAAIPILVARDHEEIARATGNAGAGAVALALLGAAVICAGGVLLTTVLRADRARLSQRTARWAVPAAAAVVVVSLLTVARGPIADGWDQFQNQGTPAANVDDPAARLTTAGGNRHDLWASALDAFSSEPLTGIGPGTFEFWWERNADNPEYVRDAHSLYLETMAELGLPGLLLLLLLLGGALGAALVARGRLTRPGDTGASVAMCSVFLVFLVAAGIDWEWEETAVTAFPLAGIAIAIAGGSSRLRQESRRGVLLRPGVRAAFVAAAILMAVIEVPGLVSEQKLRASREALTAGELDAARANAEAAVSAAPWAATPHQQLASVEEAAGNLRTARDEIETAIEKEPLNWQWPLVLAPIQAELGDRSAAIKTFRQGRALAPLLPFYGHFSYFANQVYTQDQLARIFERLKARAAAKSQN